LLLQFAGAETLDSRVTFTRTTTATRTNSSGLIESVAINGPRFDYNPTTLAPNGLLIEEQRVNLLLQSEGFDTASWTKADSSISANVIIAPDGALTGDKLVENTATGAHYIISSATAMTNGVTYVGSVYAKAAERSVLQLTFQGATHGSTYFANFNLANGIFGSSGGSGVAATITNVGNGYYRCSIAAPATATASGGLVVVVLTSTAAGRLGTYTGDGTSGLYIWGAQLEAGAFATSYIPTVASQVTRTADVATMTGTNFSDWYNATEGTFYAGFLPNAVAPATAAQLVLMASDASTANTVELFKRANADVSTRFSVTSSSVNSTFMNIGVFTQSNTKLAGAYKVNDFAGVRNAGTVVVDTSGATATVSQLNIGGYFSGSGYLNGTIKQIAFYPRRLADSELQAITS
jgi:hypothetical protein